MANLALLLPLKHLDELRMEGALFDWNCAGNSVVFIDIDGQRLRSGVELSDVKDELSQCMDALAVIDGGPPVGHDTPTVILEVIQDVDSQEGVLGALGAGLLHLARAGILVGRFCALTGNVGLDRELQALGAIGQLDSVVQSGRVVTAGSMASLPEFLAAISERVERQQYGGVATSSVGPA